MTGNASVQADGARQTVTVRRRFAHPAERVYDAWLDPAGAGCWLFATPKGEMVRVEIDARVGGGYVFTDRRDGVDAEHVGEYLELERPRRIAFTFRVPAYSPVETLVTLDIAPVDGGCELTLTHSGVLPEWAEQTAQGWGMILNGLTESLGKSATGVGKVVEIRRSFAAPRELVWAALTEPAQLAQWWGPGGWDNPVCEIELCAGGRLFIEMRGPDPWGSHPMGGTVHEVDPPNRLVFSSRAFGSDETGWQLEARNTLTLTEQDGGTLLTLHAVVTQATAAMTGPLSGMEFGWQQSLDKLDTLLEELQQRQA